MSDTIRRNELPEACFSILRSTGELIVLHRGEKGYYHSDWNNNNKEENRQIALDHNKQCGLNAAQVRAMEIGSMGGFDVFGANPQVFFDKAKLTDLHEIAGTIIDPDTSLSYPLTNHRLLQYTVAGQAAFYLALKDLPQQLMGLDSDLTIYPDLIGGKPLVPVCPEWAADGGCVFSMEAGGFQHEKEVNAGYRIIAKVGVGPVEYSLAEIKTHLGPMFATWERTPANDSAGEKRYYWGHYLDNRQDAVEDFCNRASEKYQMLAECRKPSIHTLLSELKPEQEHHEKSPARVPEQEAR